MMQSSSFFYLQTPWQAASI